MAITTVAQSDTLDTWRTTLNTTIDRWNILGESSAIEISGGTIDGTTIGLSTAAAGAFTNITVASTFDVTGATLIIDNDAISGNKISGGTIDSEYIILANDPTLSTHAARKGYVDSQVSDVENQVIALAIALG